MTIPNKYQHLSRSLIAIIALYIFLIATNPGKVALGFLVIPVLIVLYAVYELARFVLLIINRGSVTKRHQTIAMIMAVASGLILMLQSIGQIAAGDIAIILFFVVISVFYVSRFR